MAAANTMIDERDGNGRFLPGHPGGPGRPRREVERHYMAILEEVVTPERWLAVCERAIEQAQKGDRFARDWLSAYLLTTAEAAGLETRLEELEVRLRLR